MPNPFAQMAAREANQNGQPQAQTSKPSPNKVNPFAQMAEKEGDSFGKSAFRTAYQIPSGITQAVTYPLDLLSLVGHSEALDPLEIERLKEISEREGKPFNEEAYYQAAEASQQFFPTQSNIERIVEEQTGAPLTPKNAFQKGLKYASTIGKFAPGTIPQRAVIGGAVEGAKETLQHMEGLPEGAAEIAAPLLLGPAAVTQGISRVRLGKKTKPSGLVERQFEGRTSPIELSPGRIQKIDNKVEADFRKITDKLIQDSPIKTTYNAMKEDAAFRSDVQELFPQVADLAEQIPGTFSTNDIRVALEGKLKAKEGVGFTPGEYQKKYNNFMKDFIADTPEKAARASDLVTQFRLNNKELSEYFKPGESKAYNRARRDALLDYNRAIAETIEQKYPGSEFSELFKFSNKRWQEINDVEALNGFIDDLFDGKINYRESRNFLEGRGNDFTFKRALGDEGFAKFKQLNKDLMSQEEAYKLIRKAKSSGFADLGKNMFLFMVHPKIAVAKHAYDAGMKVVKGVYKAILDKPKLAFIWDDALQAMKSGRFAEAEMRFDDLKRAVQPDEILGAPKAKAKAKTADEIVVPRTELELPKKALPAPQARLTHKDEGMKIATTELPPEQPPPAPPKNSLEHPAPSPEAIKEKQAFEKKRAERMKNKRSAKSFKTEKGSSYDLHEDGTTTRNKAFRPEHGEKEQGIQPQSEATYFVSKKDADKLSEIQTSGESKKLIKTDQGQLAVEYTSGKHKGKREARTYVNPLSSPEIGAIPVEIFEGGNKVHFGNKITEISEKSPKNQKSHVEKLIDQKVKAEKSKEDQVDFKPNMEEHNRRFAQMEKQSGTNLPKVKNSDVQWYLNSDSKKPFAGSTESTNGTILSLIKDGDTYKDVFKKIHFDPDAKAIVKHFIDEGYGDIPIEKRSNHYIKPFKAIPNKKVYNKSKEPQLREIKRPDISPKALKKQKDFIIDAIDEALANPSEKAKIEIDVPGDGMFKILNNKEVLENVKKKVKSKWPVKQIPYAPPKAHPNPSRPRS